MARKSQRQNQSDKSLIGQAKSILGRLARHGWSQVFKQHGLDIKAENLQNELSKDLLSIDRTAPGFEDYCLEGMRGIENGRPEMSLLWHGLASPHVKTYRTKTSVRKIRKFATPAELEVIENLVFGMTPPSVQSLRAMAGDAPIAIVVFAKEYRPASNTVHRRHADMCYSRTGVARVGTADAAYLEDARGYLPSNEGDSNSIRILPCRYSAYVAALVNGERDTHGPMRFLDPGELNNQVPPNKDAGTHQLAEVAKDSDQGDGSRRFWVPLHKLFPGKECIAGFDLNVDFSATHVNEKIRRIHLFFLTRLHDGGWKRPDIDKPPFVFSEGIAEFSSEESDGVGLLKPNVHKSLMEIAQYKGKDLTYLVPPTNFRVGGDMGFTFSSSLGLSAESAEQGRARSAPEYVHARFASNWKGQGDQDLNELENVRELVAAGNYHAKHVIDFTGDGWVDVSCPQLSLEIPHRLSAYSIVAPPDYFPAVKQRDLMQWWEQSVPTSIKTTIWPERIGPPKVLSDQRMAANLELHGAGFKRNDDTMTAIVGSLTTTNSRQTNFTPKDYKRSSMLPDGAAGVFAPGWDTSFDRNGEGEQAVLHLAAYGLGSPFPEDAKLCAALSSYWPAVAPDITRVFEPNSVYATATPLTDTTIGQDGSEPWDGIAGPRIIDEKAKIMEYSAFAYGDYVKTGLKNGFNLAKIGNISPKEYIARTVVMARAYQAFGVTAARDKVKLAVFSFSVVDVASDKEYQKAIAETNSIMDSKNLFRIVLFKSGNTDANSDGSFEPIEHKDKPYDKVWISYDRLRTLYVDANTVLEKEEDGSWKAHLFRD